VASAEKAVRAGAMSFAKRPVAETAVPVAGLVESGCMVAAVLAAIDGGEISCVDIAHPDSHCRLWNWCPMNDVPEGLSSGQYTLRKTLPYYTARAADVLQIVGSVNHQLRSPLVHLRCALCNCRTGGLTMISLISRVISTGSFYAEK
jgi:hypothetical protein